MLVGEIICDPSVLREVYPLFLFDGGEMASTISGGPEDFCGQNEVSSPAPSDRYQCRD